MRQILLGDSGVVVSAICLGTMRFGTATDEATSFAILDRYLEAGGAFLDTANVYAVWAKNGTGGDSERLLKRWMAERRCRDRVFLATKLGSRLQGSGRGLRASQIIAECDTSLANLGVDHVDLLYAHFDDPGPTPMSETMGAFARLIEAGKVRYLGASNFQSWRLAQARAVCEQNGWPPYRCLQQRHSYLRSSPWTSFGLQLTTTPEVLAYCSHANMTILAYSPLLGGLYDKPAMPLPAQYDNDADRRRLTVIRETAAALGCTANQLVLAWMLAGDPPVIPVVGVSCPRQLAENLAAVEVAVPPDVLARLDAA